ncbi:MAG: stage II sporulation protein R [Lachnospiraceae bacterium]|nr:stage II sporulation protein R [Lachnospiraceae bacterium]
MKGFKIFRDVLTAVLLGIVGGFAVAVISYYQGHREGGMKQTALAVLNSFDTVAAAYGGDDLINVDGEGLARADKETEKASGLRNELEDVFDRIEDGDETVFTETGLAATLAGVSGERSAAAMLEGSGDFDGEIIAMDGEDGDVEHGEPYDGILRFHVRANSDSDEDQELKLAVKEDVVTMLRPLLENCEDVDESKNIIVANLQNIYTAAINTIVEQGYDYDVKVYVTEEEFPAKTYGDLTFPAGNYQALRIDIGEAQGQNWWCVMFPPLCFIDASTAVVSEEGKEALKRALTSEEYEALYAYYSGAEGGEDITIEGRSWLFDLLKK